MQQKRKTKKSFYNFNLSKLDLSIILSITVVCFCITFFIGWSLGKSSRVVQSEIASKKITEQNNLPITEESLSVLKIDNNVESVQEYENQIEQLLQKTNKVTAQKKKQTAKQANQTAQNKKNAKLFAIQVTAISDRNRAKSLVNQLKAKKFDAYVVTTVNLQGKNLYRVRVGKGDLNSIQKIHAKLLPFVKGFQPAIIDIN